MPGPILLSENIQQEETINSNKAHHDIDSLKSTNDAFQLITM